MASVLANISILAGISALLQKSLGLERYSVEGKGAGQSYPNGRVRMVPGWSQIGMGVTNHTTDVVSSLKFEMAEGED